MGEKRSSIILSAVMFAIMLFVTICCVAPREEIKITFPKDGAEYPIEQIAEVSGLERDGNQFKVIGNDPNFLIKLGENPIQSLVINFENNINSKSILVYYSSEGPYFAGERTVEPIIKTNTNHYAFDLKDIGAKYVRVDINEDFVIDNIITSQLPLDFKIDKQNISIVRVIGAILMPIVLIITLYVTKITEKLSKKFLVKSKKFSRWLKKNKINIAFSAMIYMAIGGISALAEFAYCHLIQRTPNSLGIYFDYYRCLFIFCALSTAFTLYLLRKVADKKPEYLFLAVLLISGTMLTATYQSSTGNAWDDQIHYEWVVTAPIITDGTYSKIEKENFDLSFKTPEDKYSYKDINEITKSDENASMGLIAGEKKQNIFSIYERLGHLPSAVAIQIFKTFDAPHATQVFFARMANLIIYAFVIFLAMKKLKTGKMILAVLAMIPTFVFLATNFSYDYWVNGFLALGFAYFLDGWQHPNQRIEAKSLAIILGSFVLGCGPKSVYFLFLLLPLLLKKSKPRNYKKFAISITACFVFTILAFLAISFLSISSGGDMRGGSGISSVDQVKFVLQNPVQYTKTLLSFLKGYIRIENLPSAFTKVAYINNAGGEIGILFTILLFVVAFTDKNEHDSYLNNWKAKTLMLMFLFAECALLSTALYVSFTEVGSEGISGVQLRYIFPMLFPVFAVIGTSNIKNNIDRRIYNYSVIGISTALFYIYFWGCHMTLFY